MKKKYIKLMNKCKYIEEYYKKLVKLTKNHHFVGFTNEWIIDNFYLVIEQRNEIKKIIKDRDGREILRANYDMYEIIKNIYIKHKYNVDKNTLIKELNNYQSKNNISFSYNAISVIPVYISFVLIEEIYELCKKREAKLDDLKKVDEVVSRIDEARLKNPKANINDFIVIDKYIINHPFYLYNLYVNLKEFGESSTDVFERISKYLEEHNIDLKEVINDEYLSSVSDNMLVSNLFNNLKDVTKLIYQDLCNKISKSEKELLTDPVYKKLNQSSKE